MDIDNYLYRKIKDGSEFNNLIPQSTCKSNFVGDGDTKHSVEQMQIMVQDHSFQMKQMAQKLRGNTLAESAAAVHEFLYNYFQYRADLDDQLLRSPACSWSQRQEGIDCKSYTILASSLLLEMGYSNIIRRIKQPEYLPTEYTHVYCILPIDQTTNSLAQGYYVIDGTIPTTHEPAFNQKDDTIMNHYALNAPALLNTNNFENTDFVGLAGLNSGPGSDGYGGQSGTNVLGSGHSWGDLFGLATGAVSSSSGNSGAWDQVKSFLTNIGGCRDGADTAFNTNDLKRNMDKINAWYTYQCALINTAIKNNDTAALELAVATFVMFPHWGWLATDTVWQSNNWNRCSDASFGAQKDLMVGVFRQTFTKSLYVYLDAYFDKVKNPNAKMNWTRFDILENGHPDVDWMTYYNGFNVKEMWNGDDKNNWGYTYYLKPSTANVPPFFITPYVYSKKDAPQEISIQSMLPQLLEIGGGYLVKTTVAPNSTPTSPNGNNTNVVLDPKGGNAVVPDKNPKDAGFSLVTGVILVAASVAVMSMMNKQTKTK